MTRRSVLLAGLAFAFAAAPAIAQSELARQFAHAADLSVGGDGLSMLVLPAEVIAAARADLADMRITDRAGREVPFFVLASRPARDPRVPILATILDIEQPRAQFAPRETNAIREQYRLASLRDSLAAHGLPYAVGDAWALELELAGDFVAHVDVSAPGQPSLVQRAPVFRAEGAERTRILLPPHDGELRVAIDGEQRAAEFLAPRFRFVPIGAGAAAEVLAVVPLATPNGSAEDGVSELRFLRPLGLVPSALRFEADDAAFARRVRVLDVGAEGEPREIGRGAIARIAADAAALDIPLAAPARGAALVVHIEDRDSAPLRNLRVSALVEQPALVFALSDVGDAQPDGTLHFGGAQTLRPNYDLASLAELFPDPALLERSLARVDPATTVLGAVRDNPSFAPAPALEFAMQPGAALDPQPFRFRRVLHVAATPNGLSRYRLAPEDVAAARADLADLRVSGSDGPQWPLLLAPEAAREWRESRATLGEGKPRESRYALALPAAGVRVTALELDTQSPFFDRAFRVTTRSESGAERALAGGRIARAPERPAPIRIALPGERVANLELALEDGDDAPLAFTRASVQIVLPELFVAAPAGEYALLLGDAEASAPEYEIERVRELVLAVPSRAIQAEPLAPNPDFNPARSLATGERGRTLVVWIVLGAALALLAALTLRAARHEAPIPPRDA